MEGADQCHDGEGGASATIAVAENQRFCEREMERRVLAVVGN